MAKWLSGSGGVLQHDVIDLVCLGKFYTVTPKEYKQKVRDKKSETMATAAEIMDTLVGDVEGINFTSAYPRKSIWTTPEKSVPQKHPNKAGLPHQKQ